MIIMSEEDSKTIVRNPLMFNGYRIVENPSLTVSKVEEIERNRFMHVLACVFRRPTTRVVQVPDRNVYFGLDTLIAHPEIVKEIREALEKENASSRSNSTKS